MAQRSIPFATSKNVQSILYDDETQVLTISLQGGTYEHSGVDSQKADGFSSAPSAGTYYHTYFSARGPSAGVHPHTKVG
jgi:hypothetical protein